MLLNAKLVRKLLLALSIVFVVGCNVALTIMNAKEDPSSAIKTAAQLPQIMDFAKTNLRHQEIPDHDQEDGMERIAQSNSTKPATTKNNSGPPSSLLDEIRAYYGNISIAERPRPPKTLGAFLHVGKAGGT